MTEHHDDVEHGFRPWRLLHLWSSRVLTAMAVVHVSATFLVQDAWGPSSVWFMGTGLGLLLLGTWAPWRRTARGELPWESLIVSRPSCGRTSTT